MIGLVTYFKSFEEVGKPIFTGIDNVLGKIKDCVIQDKIDAIRAETKDKERRELKKKLPCVLFAGKFTERKDAALKEHSGFCILDYDHLNDVNAKKEELKAYPYVYSIFVSPSGDGLKVVVRIPADIKKHRGYYRGLMKVFPELDTTSQNESRICFFSADPDLYLNKEATEFTDWVEEEKFVAKPEAEFINYGNDYRLIARAAEMIQKAADGEKHKILLQASKLMGGYIATGQVDEFQAMQVLEYEISQKNIDDLQGAKKTIKAGIEYGKKEPIEKIEREIRLQAKSEGIRKADDVWERMKESFVTGKERGKTTYFEKFDQRFTWKKGEITLTVGSPNAGKSEFELQLMLLRSHFDDDKWAVFSPENYPEDEFYDALIHAYIGKTTDPYYKEYQMTMDEYKKGYDFIRSHFFYIYPEYWTIDEIESRVLFLIEEYGVTGVLVDPFNQIEMDLNVRDDKFLSRFLRDRKRFALENNIYYHITAHPKTMHRNKDGKYDVIDIYDISNGAMWGNKVDNIISIFRPNYMTNPADTMVEVHVKKIKKQKLVGIPGQCDFDFDRRSNRYLIDGYSPFNKPAVNRPLVEPKQKPDEDLEEPPF